VDQVFKVSGAERKSALIGCFATLC
jgi:hypothetical protein